MAITTNEFRDKISTVNKEGKRVWVYPKKPKGRYYSARTIVSYFLLAILFGMPFIKVNKHPFMLFDVFNRKFILFGIGFGPHDFHIFVIGFIAIIIFVVLFTAIYGRLFCGWICPQTVFMEMVYRKIEYLIEGDFRDQKKLDEAAWSLSKIIRKTIKHFIFFAIAFLIGNTFMAYVTGIDHTLEIISSSPKEHLAGFIAVSFFSLVFYFIFSKFREQACIIVCPYGRLQGVLLDQNSLVVAYDFVRGEPRGRLKKEVESTNGDCIDCKLCVDVCPTGIDIRNGIQLECVNCTACIDACDEVMDKINKPRGLIRYDSIKGIIEKIRFKITPRIISYSVVLVVLLSLFLVLMYNRTEIAINIFRTPGMLYQDQPGNKISNLYNINVVNKSFDNAKIELKVKNFDAEITLLGNNLNLLPQQVMESKFILILKKSEINKINTKLEIMVFRNGKEIKTIKTSFLSNIELN
jgi:cytochrome c oxidase accessory protein FixG